MIESVDSFKLADALEKEYGKFGGVNLIDVLV